MSEKQYANYLTVSENYRLNLACNILWAAFPETVGIFLVGSSLHRRDFRDVDIRLMLRKDDYRKLFPNAPENPQGNATWDVICVSISDFLARQCGLPVDFQIQEMDWANSNFGEDHKRSAVGIMINRSTVQDGK